MTGYSDRRLESFLLDELASPEREEIEQRIFADDDLFARVEEIETDLVDAWVADRLAKDIKDRFERSLSGNPARQEKVLCATLLRTKLSAPASGKGADVIPFSRRHAAVFRGALAAALLALVIGVPMFIQRDRQGHESAPARFAVATGSETSTEQSRTTDANASTAHQPTATDSAGTSETPLIAVKRPPVPTTTVEGQESPAPAAVRSMTFVLSTVSLRSASGLEILNVGDDIDAVNIYLSLESDEFPSYNVAVRNTSGANVWTATRLPVKTIDGGPALSFEIPASELSNGRHELVLAGVDETGTEEVAYVDFTVQRR